MKICFVSNDYINEMNFGGLGTYIYNTAHGLASYGHEVHIITRGTKNSTYKNNKVHLYTIKDSFLFRKKIKKKGLFFINIILDLIKIFRENFFDVTTKCLMFNIPVYRKFLKLNNKYKFDVVECDDGGGIGFLISLHKNIKLITKLHTSWSLIYKLNKEYRKRRNLIDMKILNFLEYQQIKKSNGITSNSLALKNMVHSMWKIPESKVEIIPCSIDAGLINKLALERKNKIRGNYMLFIGRIEMRKGIEDLILALPTILKIYPNIKMIFAGAISNKKLYRNALNKLKKFENKVIFTGQLRKDELMPLIKNSTLVILPSPWEAFGYTCLESMALGKIVLATSGSGFEEQIQKDGKNGFLVPPNNYKILAEKIIKVLSMSKNKLDTVSKNAKKRAMEFDNKIIIPKLIKYYEEVIKK